MKTWSGTPPTCCDTCGDVIIDAFFDAKTKAGPWALMCRGCYAIHGVGLGTGKGQFYVQEGTEWVQKGVRPA